MLSNDGDSSDIKNIDCRGNDDEWASRRQRNSLIKSTRHGTALPHVDNRGQQFALKDNKPVSWRSLPRKDQLLILSLARLSEPLTQTSLGTYLFYQLKSFDPSLPDSTVSFQAGLIQAAFPGMQFLTAMLWGRYADSEYGGRKKVILLGLLGTMLSVLGFGFSQSYSTAIFFRCLGGILNGNIGVMRTMISEIIKEKKYQSRAFLLLPMTFNIGVIMGPILGGLLADPLKTYPSLFGPGSAIGGEHGVYWMAKWPYALPNIMSAIFLFSSALAVAFFLEETSESVKHKRDYGLMVGNWIRKHIFRQNMSSRYSVLAADEAFAAQSVLEFEMQTTSISASTDTVQAKEPIIRPKLPFRRIWTPNLIMTLISHGIAALHIGTFNSLWHVYLAAPRFNPEHPHPPGYKPHGFHFTGGLGLAPSRIGIALAVLGVIGITMQILLYPRLSHHLGTTRSNRIFLCLFPIAYLLTPFLSIVPSSTIAPAGASGFLVWVAIGTVLFIQVSARTFVMPATTILVNNCCPHPSVLGTVHGLGQSVSSMTRTFGPIMWGYIFGRGLSLGIVGLAWWTLACVAAVGAVAGRFVEDGDGHGILLEGEVRGVDGVVRRVDG
ncbi:MFS general substrate transporter [Delitschia confertaspora ATCC 74209]|uniref:MFS general substrate transporter n=1 Tax=Delitschia confertaspora ATCC 74209 TaxID=1513339 RepID=A0A9P4JZG0_9PLEO|nr:MFS general substrate transporter [Delitschia confertaspora ATCC 74209]